jgi:MscS family membrane protein
MPRKLREGSLAMIRVASGDTAVARTEIWTGAGLARRRRHARVLGTLLLALAAPAVASENPYPLEPPDTFSPRGTITTLTSSIDLAWQRFAAKDESFREPLRQAVRCLDLSSFPPEIAPELGATHALLLKEVLDRIELPATADIPDDAEVREQQLQAWTIPHTEIVLTRVASGERQGQFLFSSHTVERLPEFYEKVRDLPYQPGKQGAHYDVIRSGALSPVIGSLVAHLPAWTRLDVGNHLLWQWAMVALCLFIGIGLAVVAFRMGRGRAGREGPASLRERLAPFLFPATVLVLVLCERWVIDRFIRLAGAPYYYGRLVLRAIADLAIAWLIVVLLTLVGELVIRHSRVRERPLNAQLVRLAFRLLTILVVTGFLFLAAEALGLPVPALVAGLGVGGLAVALATQGTLENLIGGFILYADQPVRVGDFFRFGDQVGMVEEIGIRSARIRTLNRTVIAIPNADLIKMQLENFSRRDKTRLSTTLRLRMETSRAQLRYLLSRLEQMLADHPKLAKEGVRVRFVEVGPWSLDVELVAVAPTRDWNEFLAIRQDVLLRAMGLVEEAGTRLAVPVQVELAGKDEELDPARERDVAAKVKQLRETGRLGLAEYSKD